jgi:nucleoid DNA-binding protein
MTKSELIARLAERNPRLVARDADEAVNTMLDAMTMRWPAASASRSAVSAALR